MKQLGEIRKELKYSLDLADIIDVLKLIASAEFSALSSRAEKEDIIKKEIISCFSLLGALSARSEFLRERPGLPPAYLLVCSDEGFLGEVNNAIVDTALLRGMPEKARFIVLGDRGEKILKEAGVEYTAFAGITNDIPYSEIIAISDFVMGLYKANKIGSVTAIFMKFLSFTSHRVETAKLLPCDDLIGYTQAAGSTETLIEPNDFSVMEYLVKLWIENNIYKIFWSSKLSEWSIRVLHLERGTDELKEANRLLKFNYFKSVHETNDKIIREITTARNAVG